MSLWSPNGPQLVIPGGIYWRAELILAAHSISSAEAFGTPRVALTQKVLTIGIPSAEAFGTTDLIYKQVIGAQGISSAETFGTANVLRGNVNVNPTGIATAEAFGTPEINQHVGGAGIPSAEVFGTPTITTGNVNVDPTGIASAEAFGAVKINLRIDLTGNGIPSEETFGAGYPWIRPGNVNADPVGIPSGEAFGTPQINETIYATGIPTAEAFGGVLIDLIVAPPGIVSAEVFGIPELNQTIYANSVASSESFGTPQVYGDQQQLLTFGIPSAEAFGTPEINEEIGLVGILSAETFGTPTLLPGPVNIAPVGISTAEAFGTAKLNQLIVPTAGIVTAEAFGVPQLNQTAYPTGILSGEAFGSPYLDLALLMTGIASLETFGAPTVTAPPPNSSLVVVGNGYNSTSGFSGNTFTASWTDNIPANVTAAVIFGNTYDSASSGILANSVTVNIGGATANATLTHSFGVSSGFPTTHYDSFTWMAIVLDPPTGTGISVSATANWSGNGSLYTTAKAVYYTGVSSFSSFITGGMNGGTSKGTSLSLSIPAQPSSKGLVVAAFSSVISGGASSTITPTSPAVSRYTIGQSYSLCAAEKPSSTSADTIAATVSPSATWGGVGAVLLP